MKQYQVIFERSAVETLAVMDSSIRYVVMAWIKKHLVGTNNPHLHGKGLIPKHSISWRYRIGKYRLIAHIQDQSILILAIETGPLRSVYQYSAPE